MYIKTLLKFSVTCPKRSDLTMSRSMDENPEDLTNNCCKSFGWLVVRSERL